ncbi:hypothetical protein BXZ70DRAFT_928493 [Cristinia sonorae]|uniref:Uncharacterized protein n=1 Tax=Cristinia sonorae TaxID=1940300 RepID=A0A8K0URG6_9AGAR|nr:hypothetical protein BXZ70DRAFT_928493 [Cristinia sonorae]
MLSRSSTTCSILRARANPLRLTTTSRLYGQNASSPPSDDALSNLKKQRRTAPGVASSLPSSNPGQPDAVSSRPVREIPKVDSFGDLFIPAKPGKWSRPIVSAGGLASRLVDRQDASREGQQGQRQNQQVQRQPGHGQRRTAGPGQGQGERYTQDPPQNSLQGPRRNQGQGHRQGQRTPQGQPVQQSGAQRGASGVGDRSHARKRKNRAWKNEERLPRREGEEEDTPSVSPEEMQANQGKIEVVTDLAELFAQRSSTHAETRPSPPPVSMGSGVTKNTKTPPPVPVPAPGIPAGAASVLAARKQLFLERNAGDYSRYGKVVTDRPKESTLTTLGPVQTAELYLSRHPEAGLKQRRNALKVVQALAGSVEGTKVAAAS